MDTEASNRDCSTLECISNLKHVLSIDIGKCTGCRNCELACSVKHSTTFNPSRSRIRILKDESKNLIAPMVCLQCETPLCKEACPNGAIRENEHGILYVDSAVCIGCMNCVSACIYGGIAIDPITLKAIKCDHCDGDPACLKACAYGAITYMKQEGMVHRYKDIAILAPTFGLEKEGL
ncbi:MAG: 4Fe-4S dicluster domain-containing protein [Candidatus Thorarchaeota archaeon]